MERAVRTGPIKKKPELPPVAPSLPPHKKGLLARKPISQVDCPLTYRWDSFTGDRDKLEVRRYFVGIVLIATVQVFRPGTKQWGRFLLFMNSREGVSGDWFQDEKQLHNFIREQLTAELLP